MGTPMVVFRPTPGQEEKNSTALAVAGAGIRARTFEDVAASVERVLAHPALARSMRESAAVLARPHAAEDIARFVLGREARADDDAGDAGSGDAPPPAKTASGLPGRLGA
jgi:UDP-N-acetylglucosamine:LPS N-acetylglucosamine transferase